jgi:L-Ala-D/L-Glu epimerase
MKVSAVEATPFTIPFLAGMESRLASSALPIDAFPGVMVRIRTDDGLEGVAEAPARPFVYGETQRSIVAAVTTLLGPALIGMDPLDTERARTALQPPVGPSGNICAKGAVDLALHDIVCKSLQIPAYKFLGGWATEPAVQLTWLIGIGPVADSVREAARMAAAGYSSFKIKVGSDPSRDVEVVRQIRNEVGDAAVLYADANEAYTPLEAARAVGRMADANLAWIEDPCPVWLPVAVRQRLASALPIPILGDNSCITVADVLRELESGTVGMISIKTARTGFTDSRTIALIAEQFGVPCLVGTQGDSAMGTLYAAHFAAGVRNASMPTEVSYFLRLSDQLLTEALEVDSGQLSLSSGASVGLTLNQVKLARYSTGD